VPDVYAAFAEERTMKQLFRFRLSEGSANRLVAISFLLALVASPLAGASAEETVVPVEELPALTYVERVTGGADPEASLPMIIAIHGLGDKPESFLHLFDGFAAPARVIAPRGPLVHGPGRSWFPGSASDREAFEAGILEATDRLSRLVREVALARPTDGRVVVTGFSQGGMLSFALAARDGDLFTLAAPIAGFLPEGLEKKAGASPPRIEAFHGKDDGRIPLALAEATVGRLEAAGYKVTLHTYEALGHAMSPTMHREHRAALAAAVAPAQASP
jgi:phospholipase/carboxylesterase